MLLSYFCIILSHAELKIVSLVKFYILGLLVNTLATDNEYSRSSTENLPLILECTINLKHLKKK